MMENGKKMFRRLCSYVLGGVMALSTVTLLGEPTEVNASMGSLVFDYGYQLSVSGFSKELDLSETGLDVSISPDERQKIFAEAETYAIDTPLNYFYAHSKSDAAETEQLDNTEGEQLEDTEEQLDNTEAEQSDGTEEQLENTEEEQSDGTEEQLDNTEAEQQVFTGDLWADIKAVEESTGVSHLNADGSVNPEWDTVWTGRTFVPSAEEEDPTQLAENIWRTAYPRSPFLIMFYMKGGADSLKTGIGSTEWLTVYDLISHDYGDLSYDAFAKKAEDAGLSAENVGGLLLESRQIYSRLVHQVYSSMLSEEFNSRIGDALKNVSFDYYLETIPEDEQENYAGEGVAIGTIDENGTQSMYLSNVDYGAEDQYYDNCWNEAIETGAWEKSLSFNTGTMLRMMHNYEELGGGETNDSLYYAARQLHSIPGHICGDMFQAYAMRFYGATMESESEPFIHLAGFNPVYYGTDQEDYYRYYEWPYESATRGAQDLNWNAEYLGDYGWGRFAAPFSDKFAEEIPLHLANVYRQGVYNLWFPQFDESGNLTSIIKPVLNTAMTKEEKKQSLENIMNGTEDEDTSFVGYGSVNLAGLADVVMENMRTHEEAQFLRFRVREDCGTSYVQTSNEKVDPETGEIQIENENVYLASEDGEYKILDIVLYNPTSEPEKFKPAILVSDSVEEANQKAAAYKDMISMYEEADQNYRELDNSEINQIESDMDAILTGSNVWHNGAAYQPVIHLQKTYDGKEPSEDQTFSFTLSDEEGNVLETRQNSGTDILMDLPLTLDDLGKKLTYYIQETADPEDTGTVYDSTVYTLKLKVSEEMTDQYTHASVSFETADGEKLYFRTADDTVTDTYEIKEFVSPADAQKEQIDQADLIDMREENDQLILVEKQADDVYENFTYTDSEGNKKDMYAPSFANSSNTPDHPYTPSKKHAAVSVTKVWDDNDNRDELRPESITAELYAGDEKLKEVKLSEENSWTYTWKNLDEKDSEGNTIVYTVKEAEVPDGYRSEITGTREEGFTITNTLKPKTPVTSLDSGSDTETERNTLPKTNATVNSAESVSTGVQSDLILMACILSIALVGAEWIAYRKRKQNR